MEENKNMNYLNEVLQIKTKNQLTDYNKLKDKYDNLEYTKLDIEEKYLDNLEKQDSIKYLKNRTEDLETDLNKQIVKYNDEKNINHILAESLTDMTRNYNKYKQLYSQTVIETNTLKCTQEQYRKDYKKIPILYFLSHKSSL